MKAAAQYIISRTYKPLLAKYLSKTRTYSCKGINLVIPSGVFHPGFFSSTGILFQQLLKMELKNKSVLELGAGAGLLSIHAARVGARVLATDISSISLSCLQKNKELNKVEFELLSSDLFDSIPSLSFDVILINPPYYKKDPVSIEEHAWYCGKNGEYYEKLFKQLGQYMNDDTETLMVLCDGCDLEFIKTVASKNNFNMHCLQAVYRMLQYHYVFQIKQYEKGC